MNDCALGRKEKHQQTDEGGAEKKGEQEII